MLGDPYQVPAARQKGLSYHGGMRGVSFGWHLNTSAWSTQSDFHKVDMTAAGAGATVFDFTVYGERNWRHVQNLTQASPEVPLSIQPASSIGEYTLAYQGLRGLAFGVVREDMSARGLEGRRQSAFIDLHPIPWIQLEIWRRRETIEATKEDTLGILHLYADF